MAESATGDVGEVALLAGKLGLIAFGGPAAHIAMLRDEVVERRRWLSDERFLDLLGATNLIPGPNSTEMVIHVGYLRAGWKGLLLAGICFISPAALMVLGLAWIYVEYGSTPAAEWLLYGIKPVVIAVVLQALWALGRTALSGWMASSIAILVLGLYLAGVNELLLLAAGGIAALSATTLRSWTGTSLAMIPPLPLALVSALPDAGPRLAKIFLLFLKVGAVLYGSGYVLLAFLRNDFVVRLGWLTDQQLIDAIAIGQVTPGPVFTTATFVGYLVGGWPGAVLATVVHFRGAGQSPDSEDSRLRCIQFAAGWSQRCGSRSDGGSHLATRPLRDCRRDNGPAGHRSGGPAISLPDQLGLAGSRRWACGCLHSLDGLRKGIRGQGPRARDPVPLVGRVAQIGQVGRSDL